MSGSALVNELEEFVGEVEMRRIPARATSRDADTMLASVLGTLYHMAVRARGGDEGPVARVEAIRAVRRGAARGRVLWAARTERPKPRVELVEAAMGPFDGHIEARDVDGSEHASTVDAVDDLIRGGRLTEDDDGVHFVREGLA